MVNSIDLINQAPEGTKLWLLHLGNLECDEGFLMRGAGMATASNPNPTPKRRRLLLLSVLIEHPTEGLILYETGAGDDYPEVVGPQVMDVFHRTEYTEDMTIQSQIAKTGHDIKDIKMIIMGHLHLDHAGGLEPFRKTGIPVYVHELELKHAYYCVATGSDNVYMPDHLSFDINWVAFHGSTLEIAPGINVHHSPGHTPGLSIIQVNMPKTGTWIFTSDQYHVKENFIDDVPQGWLARDHDSWVRSHQMIKALKKRTKARVVLGHCAQTIKDLNLEFAPTMYD